MANKLSTKEILLNEKKELLNRITEIEQTLILVEKYPDIEINVNRWGKKRFSTSAVNDKVTNCDIGYNCGCCNDSPLEVWPFLVENGQAIYSNPARFTVGEKYGFYGTGDSEYESWEEKMRAEKISETVIDQVRTYFRQNPPVSFDDSDDENDD